MASNQSILEDGTALGDLNATDIDGLTDGSYYSISAILSMVTPRSIPSTETGATPHPHFFGDDNTISLTDDLNQSYFEMIEEISYICG